METRENDKYVRDFLTPPPAHYNERGALERLRGPSKLWDLQRTHIGGADRTPTRVASDCLSPAERSSGV
ncbi:hypothetical protein PAXRUDRAFT_830102 [Paxillus rubicundulus Ve08.2h10]|uniref:Uncharacterized protein n=1 Tax=Paxillus rubicundulus Ve08.2h10 TaxID=930991 RepID=A0A0D0DLP4_9AGAM|nr:hypothetical protein PAXRUDRAFT_830102 [Paxillus rubicundulus Ve08.2h10]